VLDVSRGENNFSGEVGSVYSTAPLIVFSTAGFLQYDDGLRGALVSGQVGFTISA